MALAPDKIPSIFQDPPWLGFMHNGHPTMPLDKYFYPIIRGELFPEDFNREFFAILQSFLSFGLIEAVIGCPVPEDALLRTREDGRQVLCLEYLPELLAPWVRVARVEGESLTLERKRVYLSLDGASKTLLRLTEACRDFRLDYDGAEADNLPAMFCTLGCIGETLTRARACLYPDSNPGGNFSWDLVTSHQKDRLLGDACAVGWCPSNVNYVYSLAGLSSARFFFRRPPVQKAGDHSQCTIAGCALSKVDVNNYVAQHAVESCECSYAKPPPDLVVQLINSGSNPVMMLPKDERSALSKVDVDNYVAQHMVEGRTWSHTKPPLDLVVQLINSGMNPVMMLPKDERSGSRIEVADGSKTPYIAISHVWADGLGGSTETGIPYCQFFKCSCLAALFGVDAFWLDALCVPEDPSVRQKALKLMGRAYREAKLVIVLDKTLQSVSLKSPVKDLLSCILTSPWMRRMWTFQEAALAKSIHFQLLDGMLSLWEISRIVDDVSLQTDDALASMFQEVFRLSVRHWQKMTLCDVAHALKWRSTSRPSDEIPAIVSLLGVDVDRVLSSSVPLERRMETMLLNLQTVPRDIPFLNVPKLDHPCFRWAPATFMSVALGDVSFGGSIAMSNLSQTAQVTPEGLVAEYLVCEIEPREFNSGETWTLVDDNSNNYVIADVSENASNYQCNFLLFPQSSMPSKLTKCIAVLGEEGMIPSSAELGVCCTYGRKLAMLGHRAPIYPVDNPVVLKHIPSVRKVMIS